MQVKTEAVTFVKLFKYLLQPIFLITVKNIDCLC